ncbi:Rxt3p KNAG_0D04470 [Huiozyma naganishii CBS 8797]|uniref:Uncharacterized protein n=1 Tax=Huiozyma naganishii (strain ATCC MYA-139 / BCRC 22969 / CBS 8797 / KCTC 17520 / NBRC 10181 / NCYC 3082 / Yp74L-3) TaxID=1071383 RepID=J7RYF5_HUIN7|nr:hypothetical protein KNAG_0D04470 [Kazachstania naganishii CBS 8797]CCK70192.1 hypothetical protein KNAG_0D04470 [Kazachstania naganishii CBS 8797]
MSSTANTYDPNEAYRKTQSQIYRLQETILDSSKEAKKKYPKDIDNKPESSNTGLLEVNSFPVLQDNDKRYKSKPRVVQWLTYYEGPSESTGKSLPFPYDVVQRTQPFLPPFLPALPATFINKIISIRVPCEEIDKLLQNKSSRLENLELWGSDIYTDDSDPLLMLLHMGVFHGDPKNVKRTPANLKAPDFVVGSFEESKNKKYDVITDLLMLDTLESYHGCNRYGVTSRDWAEKTPHDGLSCGVYKLEFRVRDETIDSERWYK